MVAEAQRTEERDAASTSLARRCSDLDLHRIDLTARLLAFKEATLNPESLIVRTAAHTRRSYDRQLDAVLFIAGMIRISATMVGDDDGGRSLLAAERLTDLMAALGDPSAVTYLRNMRRRGELDRPPPLDTQRLLRRACWRGRPADARVPTREPLPAAAWDALLDNLARSLAVDREAEVQIDISLDGLDAAGLARRRDWVRAAIFHGESVVDVTETSPTDVFDSTPMSLPGGDGWSPPERLLLPAGHRIGRFTLLQKLGDGAMGVVYAAYDPELDRRIAVKLLRARAGSGAARAQARLLREAQAMARVAHPNVAVVHDVGTHDGDVFVAMEFVRGATLQGWLRERPRGWQEVVDVFVQAGRGLAAAHAAGLVHRDFKPSNAMIGDDARVRVLDFGLCYSESAEDLAEPTLESEDDVRITRRGDIVGTPAYMPPEQYNRSGDVGPSADQFSFCASLYEALYEQLPFPGETIQEVAGAIARGDLRPPPKSSRVPAWLHGVVQRGLQSEPHDRYPSMDALLQALDRISSTRTRRGVVLAAGFAALAGAGGFWAASSSQPAEEDRCSGGALEISAAWDADRRALAEQALAAAGPAYAEEVWPRLSADLDRYADTWQTMHRAACEAHQRGETSGALLDRRMACLAARKAALAEAASVLGSADVAVHALEVVANLPPLDRCTDLVALEADVPPPADPDVRARIDAVRPRLARVATLEHAGQSLAAIALADDVVRDAETIGERALLAEALLQRGRLDINRADVPREHDAILTRAYLTALGGRLDELAAEALALRLYVRSRLDGAAARALDDLPVAQEMVARLPAPARVNGLLLNNAGVVHMAAGDVERAAALFRDALAAREAALGPDHVEVAFTLFNLALVAPDPERLVHRALAIFDHQLGRAHPQSLDVRLQGSFLARDPRDARALVAPACDTIALFAPGDLAQRARCLSFLGHHAEEAGDLKAAVAAFTEVGRLLASDAVALPAQELASLRGRAALHAPPDPAAAESLRAAIPPPIADEAPWARGVRAEYELLLGQHLQRLADVPAARAALTAAVADFEAAPQDEVLTQQRLAVARTALADLLADHPVAPDDAPLAASLRQQAQQWYRNAGPGYAWRLVKPRD
jgi:hypothetical protein